MSLPDFVGDNGAVISEPMVAPRKTPCTSQSFDEPEITVYAPAATNSVGRRPEVFPIIGDGGSLRQEW